MCDTLCTFNPSITKLIDLKDKVGEGVNVKWRTPLRMKQIQTQE